MSIEKLKFGDPFFRVTYIEQETTFDIEGSAIVLNLAEQPIQVEQQTLGSLQSSVIYNSTLKAVDRAVVLAGFDEHDPDALYSEVKKVWPLAFDVRKEERLRGVSHYMGPKITLGNISLGLYHSGSVPLKVGLHRDHPWCEKPGFKEVHTQIVGFGKMQQCREKDINTLYLEEPMSPGTTHRPMYDSEGNYPWHQYETVTPSIFMAVEILPTD